MKILARQEITTDAGKCTLLACRPKGDPFACLFARLSIAGEAPGDSPEIRVRCKPEQLDFFWRLAVEQAQAALTTMD